MSTTWEPGAVYIRLFATPHFYASRALVAIRPETSWGRRPRLERLLPVDRRPLSTDRCADLVGRLSDRLEWNRSAQPPHHRIRDEDTIMRTPARPPQHIVGTDDSGAQKSSTTLRIDFSRETAARIIAEGGDWYVDLVLRAGTVSGVFLILYDEDYEHIDPFADEATGPFGTEPAECGAGPDERQAQAAGEGDAEYANVHRGLVHAAIDELAMSFATVGVDTLSAWWVSRERFGRIDEDGYLSTPLIAATTSACATELVASGSNPAEAPEDLVIGPMTAEAFAHSRGGHTDEWMGTEEAFAILAEIYPHLEAMRDDESINEARINALLDLPTVMAVDALMTKKWSRDALEMILSFDHPDFPPARLARLDGDA